MKVDTTLHIQPVLGCLGATEPQFQQGALQGSRERLITHDMDRRLLKRTEAFDWKKLPKTLRVAVDSAPLEGAGRVEDTINLLGHAGRKVAAYVAGVLDWSMERVCREAGAPLLAKSSMKKALDLDWSGPAQKASVARGLAMQVATFQEWIATNPKQELKKPPLKDEVETLAQLIKKDFEPDPDGGGMKTREGVAPDRRVSVEDKEMRHCRKSKSKRFNGYKRHTATDLDSGLILSGAITPTNRPEDEAAPARAGDIEKQDLEIRTHFIDRGYVKAAPVDEALGHGGEIVRCPWIPRSKRAFTKTVFKINMRDLTITCLAGEAEPIEFGSVTEFDPESCDHCPQRAKCTAAALVTGALRQHRRGRSAPAPSLSNCSVF